MKTLSPSELPEFQAEFLIVTTAEVEKDAVLARLSPAAGCTETFKVPYNEDTYYLGNIGRYACVVVQTEQGSDGRAGAHQTVNDAIERWHPHAVAAVGIAFGCKPDSQVFGDVLVSTKLYPYDHKKVTPKGNEQRASEPEASLVMLNRVKNSSWTWATAEGVERKPSAGPLLSGNSLVNSAEFRDGLLLQYQDAIGGEMEGTGLYASAARKNTQWIVMKAVCDWGARKTKDQQGLAASNAVEFLLSLLSEPGLEAAAFGRESPRKSDGQLERTTRSLVMLDVEKRIRAANDAKLAAQEKLHTLIDAGTVTNAEGKKVLAELAVPEIKLAQARLHANTEAWLNAYNDAGTRYLNDDLDDGQFEASFGEEIVQILRTAGPHTEILKNAGSAYASLKSAGSRVVARKLRKQLTVGASRVLETFIAFKIGRNELLPVQSLMADRDAWNRREQDAFSDSVRWLLDMGLLQEEKLGYVLTPAGYDVAYAE